METAKITKPSKKHSHINWNILIGISLIHIGALFAPFTFTWQAFWVFISLEIITGLGVTLCYHRLLAHRSFSVPKWLEYCMTICAALALQGGPIKWVSTHRVHHAFSDRPQDPHSPNRGFWWAHMVWLFVYDEVLDDPNSYWWYASDLAKERGHRIIEKTSPYLSLILLIGLYAWGGFSFVVWGMFVRLVIVYHVTWLVNSAAHIWGYQSYDTNEQSRNNWWVALLSFGEGWHNNHHAFLHSAAHGLKWWEFDSTYIAIKCLKIIRIAKSVRLPIGNPAKLPDPDPLCPKNLKLPVPHPSTN